MNVLALAFFLHLPSLQNHFHYQNGLLLSMTLTVQEIELYTDDYPLNKTDGMETSQ